MTPAQERAAIVDYLRKQFGTAAVHLILASGMPGGTRTQRVKAAAAADGFAKAVSMMADKIESGAHHEETQ